MKLPRVSRPSQRAPAVGLVLYALCDPLQHAPWLKNERREHNSAQVCARPQLRDDV